MKNKVVKITVYNKLIKKVNSVLTSDTSNLVKNKEYDTKIKEIEDKIPDVNKYITT